LHAFNDRHGREWRLIIEVDAIERIRDETGVNLYELLDDEAKVLRKLMTAPRKLVEVLWVLVADQAAAAKVEAEDFGRSFDGDALEAASEAFQQEAVSFFPKPIRQSARKLLAKGRDLMQELLSQADEQIAAIDPKKEAASLVERLRLLSGPALDN
jgi:hypothetical protein